MYRVCAFIFAFFVLTQSRGQGFVPGTIPTEEFKYEIHVPGKPGEKDSITIKYTPSPDHIGVWDGSYTGYYASGIMYEKGEKQQGKDIGIAKGYYPNGNVWWIDFYHDGEVAGQNMNEVYYGDSVYGFYPSGKIYYKVYQATEFIYHEADSSTGMDNYIQRASENSFCNAYDIYYPNGSQREHGSSVWSLDSIAVNPRKVGYSKRDNEGPLYFNINERYQRTHQDWHMNGVLTESSVLFDYVYGGEEFPFFVSYERRDSSGVLVMEGKSIGLPFILKVAWDPMTMNGMGEPGEENKKYQETFIKYYSSGKPEWIMKGRHASLLRSLNLENPNPDEFEGWETLIHFDEKGKIIQKWRNVK